MLFDLYKFLIACTAAILFTCSTRAAVLSQSVVFQQGENGYHTFRVPAIVKAANGDLLAFAEGRVNSTSDTGNIDIVMKRSTNGGLTWHSFQVVRSDGGNTVGNPVPILDANTGNLVLVQSHNLGQDTQDEIQNGTSDGTRTVWVQTSSDNGASWSTPVEITSSVKQSQWRWYATGPGGGTQLTRGTQAGRLVVASAYNSGPGNGTGGGVQLIYSDDGGATWHPGAKMVNNDAANYLPSESQALQLTNGNVYVNSRNRAGGSDMLHYRAVSYLGFGGQTFIRGFQETQLLEPVVEGSIERLTAVDEGDNANRILFANPFDPERRREMTVRTSYDETATWNIGKMIYRGPSGYSDMVKISAAGANDPYMGLLYENGIDQSYERISFARFNRTWLEDPGLMQIDFRNYSSGATISAGSTIFDKEGNGINGTLVGNGVSVVAGDQRYVNGETGGQAIHFDGQNDYIRIDDTSNHLFDFEADESFTLEVIFRTTAHTSGGSNGSGPLIAKDVGPSSPSYWLRIQDGNLRFLIDDGNQTAAVTSPAAVTDGNWHHVAAVRDAASMQLKLYLDGQLVDTDNDLTTGDFANSNDLIIGAFNASSPGIKRFLGDLYLARISMEALNVSQFVQPNFPPGDANGDGLVNLADLQILGDHWQTDDAYWIVGDFTGDGKVNLADLQVLGDHWGYGASLDMTFKEALNVISLTIPEPTSFACMILAVSALSCRTSWGRKKTVLHLDWTE